MLKVASVGLGWWSDALAEAVQAKTDKLRIVVGVARSAVKRDAFAARFGGRTCDSYEVVLRDPEVEGVILTTPHSLHADHVVAAAKAGKHVFVEKPFALTAGSAAEAAAACRKAGVVLAVGQNRRFAAAAVELKRLVAAGTFGTILHAEANFSAPSALAYTPAHWRASRLESPAGGLAGLAIHMIDMLIWLLGPMARVICQAKRRSVQVDIDDTTSALVEFKAGYTGYLATQCAAPYAVYLRLIGTAASAEARADFTRLELQRAGGRPEAIPLPTVDTLLAELEAYADACAGSPAYPVSIEDAIHGVAVMDAMARSAERGGIWLDVGSDDRATRTTAKRKALAGSGRAAAEHSDQTRK